MINLQLFTFNKGIATYNGKVRSQYNNADGYKCVKIKGKHRKVHRLVAQKYIPNPNNLPQVDHIDDDITNNKASNLQWLSVSDNAKKAYANNGFKLDFQQSVSIMAKKGDEQLIFPSVSACARHLNRSHQGASKALNGITKKCAGYKLSRVTIIN